MTPPTAEEILRRFADRSPDLIYRARLFPTRAFEYISPSCVDLTGYSAEDHYRDPWLPLRVVHPDDRWVYERLFVAPDASDGPFVLRWIKRDGTVIWVEDQAHLVRDSAGEIVAVEGIARDITARKRVEDELRRSRAQLQEVQAIGHLGSWEWDAVTGETTWSDECYRLLGLEPATCPPARQTFLAHVHPDDRGALCIGEPKPAGTYDVALRIVRPDGEVRDAAGRYVVFTDEAGRELRRTGTLQDVTELRRAEARERHARAQLEEAQAIARMGSWEWTVDTDVVTWSDELYRLWGLSKDTFRASIAAYLALVHPDDRQRTVDIVERTLRTQQPVVYEHRAIASDGQLRWMYVRAQPFVENGRVVRVAGTSQDITPLRQLEARVAVADRIASLGLLAGGIAHEINNPLAFVLGNLDLIDEGLRASPGEAVRAPEVRAQLAQIREGVDRIARIVRDLRSYSRGDDQTIGPVDLGEVIALAVDVTRNETRHRATVEVSVADLPPVEANEVRLGQVFVNLIVNAAHAIREGAAAQNRIQIRGGVDPGGRVFVEVQDTGCGIPPELRERIFDPFFTTKPVGAGTGLGLAICHTIVTSFGGEIRIDSEVGRGSTFRVLLKPNVRAIPPPPAGAPVPPPLRRGRVLLVDDDALVANLLARTLSRDHDVTCDTSGRRALQRIAGGERFDVVVCDLMMPDLTGMDLHEQLARDVPDQARRMIFMTGGAFTTRGREFLTSVDNPRLEKPFRDEALQAAIQAVLAVS